MTLPYTRSRDKSLNKTQVTNKSFKPKAMRAGVSLRAKSNPTLQGINSGYHETYITTDTFALLKLAKDNNDGTHSLPMNISKKSFFYPYRGLRVQSATLKAALELADGFRSDTAITVLSGTNSQGAGHTGSNADISGQGAAHDLLRASVVRVLQLKVSKSALATIMASVTSTSSAPAEIARTVPGASGLKGGAQAMRSWEKRRNEVKRRIELLFALLSRKEQAIVTKEANAFLASTQVSQPTRAPVASRTGRGPSANKRVRAAQVQQRGRTAQVQPRGRAAAATTATPRRIERGASPIRHSKGGGKGPQGLGYKSAAKGRRARIAGLSGTARKAGSSRKGPSMLLPRNVNKFGTFVSAPLRLDRRK